MSGAGAASGAGAGAGADPGPLVLVTGATGFIATHLVAELLAAGYRVRGTVRNPDPEATWFLTGLPGAERLELVKADLGDASSWDAAVAGCAYVHHCAAMVPARGVESEDAILQPAVEGTLNVLKACAKASTVRRVLLTGSVSALSTGSSKAADYKYSEADWATAVTDPSYKCKTTLEVYGKAKALAEREAWAFAKANNIELVTLLPGMVVGDLLAPQVRSSTRLIYAILTNSFSFGQFDIQFGFVSVADVARAHAKAMVHPGAAGQRYLLCSKNMTLTQVARVFKAEFGPKGFDIATNPCPPTLAKLLFRYHPDMKVLQSYSGTRRQFDNSKAVKDLGSFSPVEPALVVRAMPLTSAEADRSLLCHQAMAQSLVDYGIVKAEQTKEEPSEVCWCRTNYRIATSSLTWFGLAAAAALLYAKLR